MTQIKTDWQLKWFFHLSAINLPHAETVNQNGNFLISDQKYFFLNGCKSTAWYPPYVYFRHAEEKNNYRWKLKEYVKLNHCKDSKVTLVYLTACCFR